MPSLVPMPFARNRSESKYPHLWGGLVGAWCPCLGPTGGKLWDRTGLYQNHGTLTNMTLATAWTVSEGRSALRSQATTNYVTLPTQALPSGNISRSISLWFSVTGTTRQGFVGCRPPSASEGWFFGIQNSTTLWYPIIGVGTASAPVSISANTVYHAAFTHDANSQAVVFYLNGRQVGTATIALGTLSTATNSYLFREQEGVSAENLVGTLSDVLCYKRSVAPYEVFQIYQLGPGGIFALADRPAVGAAAAARVNRGASMTGGMYPTLTGGMVA